MTEFTNFSVNILAVLNRLNIFLTHSWVFWLLQCILIHINSEALPINYLVCSVSRISWQTLQPITLCYFFLYLTEDSLSHEQWQTGSNAGLEANYITLRLPPGPLSYPLDIEQVNLTSRLWKYFWFKEHKLKTWPQEPQYK